MAGLTHRKCRLLCSWPHWYPFHDSTISLLNLSSCPRITRDSTQLLTCQFSSKKPSPVSNSREEKDSSGTGNIYEEVRRWDAILKLYSPNNQLFPLSSGLLFQQGQIRERRVKLFPSNRPSENTFKRCLVQKFCKSYRIPSIVPELTW